MLIASATASVVSIVPVGLVVIVAALAYALFALLAGSWPFYVAWMMTLAAALPASGKAVSLAGMGLFFGFAAAAAAGVQEIVVTGSKGVIGR